MTSPVIYMPLNQDLINANLTVEQLQEFQHVDNVVEVQLEPPPPPPPPSSLPCMMQLFTTVQIAW